MPDTARVQPDPIHDRLAERVDDWVQNALDPQSPANAVRAVLDICRREEEGALRWQDQLPVPMWIRELRGAIADALGIEQDTPYPR